ncbi:MAG: hypothetical protein AAB225_13750 [Acidobacteriota bacterium]
MLVSGPAGPKESTGIWVLPAAGGPLRKLEENAWAAVMSPDDSRIVFHRGAGIWVVDAAGREPRQLLAARPGYYFIEALAWSPDGRRIAFGRRSQAGDEFAIESLDLNTGRTAVILSDPKAGTFGAFCWARDGRIIYARLEDPPNEKDSNLWDISVDPRTGQVRGQPRRLTNWGGFLFGSLAVSADGKRLFSVGMRYRSDVYLAALEGSGARFTTPRRLTFEEWINRPTGWTRDSQAVLFYSDRNGDLDIFQQGVNTRQAQAIVRGPEDKRDPRPSPDGRWILYLAWPKEGGQVRTGEGRLMRVAVGGGPPETVLRVAGYPGPARVEPEGSSPALTVTGHPRFRCPAVPQSPCVLSEQAQNQVVFTAFDPVEGRKGELTRIDGDLSSPAFWDLSPDGRWIAFATRAETSSRIRLLSLVGQGPHEISAGGWTQLQSVAWAADGKALFVTGWASKDPPLLRVSLEGKAQLLYKGHHRLENLVPSPDGRYLAFADMELEGNAWVIENFR